jgi:hypothetical protein
MKNQIHYLLITHQVSQLLTFTIIFLHQAKHHVDLDLLQVEEAALLLILKIFKLLLATHLDIKPIDIKFFASIFTNYLQF